MIEKFRTYFKNYCLMMGIMSLPALIIDKIWENSDSRFFWLIFVFSAVVPIINMIYESFNFFGESVILRRIIFFVIIVSVLMLLSWLMNIIDNVPFLLLGIGCCSAVGIPLIVLLGLIDKRKTRKLNERLREYKTQTFSKNNADAIL